jgi:sulfoxide reductase heme-binding subunit YedZ
VLHKLVYLIAVLAVIHYLWLVKNAYAQPLLFATAVGVLLLIRVPAVRSAILRARGRKG